MVIEQLAPLAAVDYVSAGIVALVCILIIVFAVMAAKTWHWVNVVFLVLSLFAGVATILGASQVLELRRAVMLDYEKKLKASTEAETRLFEAIQGPPLEASYSKESLRYNSKAYELDTIGRARVWNGGSVAAVAGSNERKFTFASPRNIAEDGSLMERTLFAFQEQQVDGQMYPTRYIGSVAVTAETENDVNLIFVNLVNGNEYGQPSSTWTLYEKMPQDRRSVYLDRIQSYVAANPDAPAEYQAIAEAMENRPENAGTLETPEIDISAYRRILRDEFLPAGPLGYDPNSDAYEDLLNRYNFDGMSLGRVSAWMEANSANLKSTRFEPVPEEVFVKYRFDEDSQRDYVVDAEGKLQIDGLLNQAGRAVVPTLKNNEPIRFQKGDVILVDKRTAEGYQRNDDTVVPKFTETESVTQIDEIYVRQTRDYPYLFRQLIEQVRVTQEAIKAVEEGDKVQVQSLEKANDLSRSYDAQIANLREDQQNLENDLADANQAVNQKTQTIEDQQAEIARLNKKVDETYLAVRNLLLKLSRSAFADNANQ